VSGCIHPITAWRDRKGQRPDGRWPIVFDQEEGHPGEKLQLPCGQCIECRLARSRMWAVRCVHEAQMHEENVFITLTYSPEELKKYCPNGSLNKREFVLFMKRLRFKLPGQDIGVFVTGEYGEQKKRPHWHAIIFNWHPPDAVYKYSNERGDKIYSSKTLQDLWGLGVTELGSVTFESAGYCARYAAKKLVHGHDQKHDFHPISKKSCKHAIGKKFLEKNWQDIFNAGFVLVEKKDEIIKSTIPRYYEKWLKQNQQKE